MGVVWKCRPVEQVALVELSRWRLLRVSSGEVNLVGFRAERCTARVSTPVLLLDGAARSALTKSGRQYRLVGEPRADEDADFVWREWSRANRVASWEDVSRELLSGAEHVAPCRLKVVP